MIQHEPAEGAGDRLLAHIAALNPDKPRCATESWAWLYPPQEPDRWADLRVAYTWSAHARGALLVAEWKPDADPMREPPQQGHDLATLWAWPDRVQIIASTVRPPPSPVLEYLQRLYRIALGAP